MTFSIDSSGLIEGWHRFYCPDVFPSIWSNMRAAAEAGTIVAAHEVRIELEIQDDDVCRWAKQFITFVSLDEDIQAAVSAVLGRFRNWVRAHGSKPFADPFVVGLALARGWPVVSMERRNSTSSERRPKLPDVCDSFNVKCYSLVEMFRELNWQA